MGMYTEIIFGARLKEDTPDSVIEAIRELMDPKVRTEQPVWPDHEYFRSERMYGVFHSDSYYFPGCTQTEFEYDTITRSYSLFLRHNLKDYNNEIKKFLDWIKPYIEQGSGSRDFYAIVCYEEDDEPTIYYLKESEDA